MGNVSVNLDTQEVLLMGSVLLYVQQTNTLSMEDVPAVCSTLSITQH